ncbi:MAG: hypothetical protein H0U24_02330 [Thermoleophilaceae bacterium]|nr:hypothetical protein [Thermoleophilaceae bacterium]
MTLWWIGNVLFAGVIIPLVIWILNRVLEPAQQIEYYADDILDHGAQFPVHLEALGELGRTRDLARQVNSGLTRYGRALDDVS